MSELFYKTSSQRPTGYDAYSGNCIHWDYSIEDPVQQRHVGRTELRFHRLRLSRSDPDADTGSVCVEEE